MRAVKKFTRIWIERFWAKVNIEQEIKEKRPHD
jgi:hypothetical protein